MCICTCVRVCTLLNYSLKCNYFRQIFYVFDTAKILLYKLNITVLILVNHTYTQRNIVCISFIYIAVNFKDIFIFVLLKHLLIYISWKVIQIAVILFRVQDNLLDFFKDSFSFELFFRLEMLIRDIIKGEQIKNKCLTLYIQNVTEFYRQNNRFFSRYMYFINRYSILDSLYR